MYVRGCLQGGENGRVVTIAISRYRRHYGSKVNRSKQKTQTRRHCICKHGDAIYSSWQLYTYRHGRKEVFVNLLVRKIIYDYMYPVDLENNERSCEYSAIVE